MKKVIVELDLLDAKTLSSFLLHYLVMTTSPSPNEDEIQFVERIRAALACAHPMTAADNVITPGFPLTEDEQRHVEQVLYDELAAGRSSFHTPDFLRLLKWTQNRHADLRDYLEQNQRDVTQRLSAKLGRRVRLDGYVTRSSGFSFEFPVWPPA